MIRRATQLPWFTSGLIAATLIASWVAPLDATLSANAPGALFWQGALAASEDVFSTRGLTAHFLHTDSAHLLWNLLGLVVLCLVLERVSRKLLLSALVAGMVGVTLWFHLIADSAYYVGWSGVLNSLLVCALWALYLPAGADYPAATRWLNNLVLGAIAAIALAKHGWELATDTALVTHTLWPSAPGAHLAGICAGCVVSAVNFRQPWRRYSPMSSFQS